MAGVGTTTWPGVGPIDPLLVVSKSVQTRSDPVNGAVNPKAIPGGVLRYSITVTNQAGEADADTVVITDLLPVETVLFVSDINGPGSGPVLFQDGTPVSGLSYTFISLSSTTDDVDFSADGGVSYTYVPVPDADGFDANVTHLRVTPKGTFNASDGINHPEFTIEFDVKVR